MAPGGSTYKEVLESHSTVADYDIAITKADANLTPAKAATVLGGKRGFSTPNGVHDLLECPVCTSLMYPPIYQVCCQLTIIKLCCVHYACNMIEGCF